MKKAILPLALMILVVTAGLAQAAPTNRIPTLEEVNKLIGKNPEQAVLLDGLLRSGSHLYYGNGYFKGIITDSEGSFEWPVWGVYGDGKWSGKFKIGDQEFDFTGEYDPVFDPEYNPYKLSTWYSQTREGFAMGYAFNLFFE